MASTDDGDHFVDLPLSKKIGAWAGSVAFVVGPAYFIFDKLQVWVLDQSEPTSDSMMWIFPTVASLLYLATAMLAITLFLYLRHRPTPVPIREQKGLANALVDQASSLLEAGKFDALVKFRNGVTDILHTEGFHKERTQIGASSLPAAVKLRDYESQVSIRLDDLGWAIHMQGDDDEALVNIERGLELCQEQIDAGKRIPFLLRQEKGLRHKALITAKDDLEQATGFLVAASAVLDQAEKEVGVNSRELKIERANLRHAHALSTVLYYRLETSGEIRPGDTEAKNMLEDALVAVRESRQGFLEGKSHSHRTKALILESRILDALGRRAAKDEVDALIAEALESTSWQTENKKSRINA